MGILYLNRYRITSRIYVGFGCLIALAVGIASYGYWQVTTAERIGEMLITVNANTATNLTSISKVEVMRRAATAYQAFGDSDAVTQFNTAYTAVTGALETSARLTTSEERRRNYKAMLTSVAAAKSDFEQLIQMSQTFKGTTKACG